MNNFGVIELASTKTTHAPGWAYVPDTAVSASLQQQPSNRKRARNQPALSLSDVSARQDAKVRKELEALDRDNHKDANIPIPAKPAGSRALNKSTPNVRKILQSQKTFANHLDDHRALLALADSNPVAAAAFAGSGQQTKTVASKAASPALAPATSAPAPSNTLGKRSVTAKGKKKGGWAYKKEREERARAAAAAAAAESNAEPNAESKADSIAEPVDVEMTDADATPAECEAGPAAEGTPVETEEQASGEGKAEVCQQEPPPPMLPTLSYPPNGTILPPYRKAPIAEHPSDAHPLLVSVVPPFPSDEELRALMTAPPLTYLEARATWRNGTGDDSGDNGLVRKYPVRDFCLLCGYWGRVRCMKCGGRVCALDCLEMHREECITRYGL